MEKKERLSNFYTHISTFLAVLSLLLTYSYIGKQIMPKTPAPWWTLCNMNPIQASILDLSTYNKMPSL